MTDAQADKVLGCKTVLIQSAWLTMAILSKKVSMGLPVDDVVAKWCDMLMLTNMTTMS